MIGYCGHGAEFRTAKPRGRAEASLRSNHRHRPHLRGHVDDMVAHVLQYHPRRSSPQGGAVAGTRPRCPLESPAMPLAPTERRFQTAVHVSLSSIRECVIHGPTFTSSLDGRSPVSYTHLTLPTILLV